MINTERSFMFSACAGESSMASHTLTKRFLFIGRVPSIDRCNAWHPKSDPLELRHVQNSECSGGISDADFPHASADGIHRLPIVRLASLLHAIELIPRLAACRLRECAQILER